MDIKQQLFSECPNITKRRMYSILLSIKGRFETYGTIGLSRLEAARYGISERQMNNFIQFLRDYGYIQLKGKVKSKGRKFLCNVYSLADMFIGFIKNLPDFNDFIGRVFKQVTQLSAIEFAKLNFDVKEKYSKYKFKYNDITYIIHKRGKFKDMIYDTCNNKIVTNYWSILGRI